jgi:deoxyribonucleoside regulator
MIGNGGLLWKSGFLDNSDTVKLRESGAVGAICGRFFDANGQKCWGELDGRTIGLSLEDLSKIKHKVCIVTGKEKIKGVLGALRGRLLDVLITDESTAHSLLAQD